MVTELYVGNLPYTATDDDLTQLFQSAGQVERVRVVHDRETGRSRGFGFVSMSSENDAATAIGQFNEVEFKGRRLSVKKAEPRAPRTGGYQGGNSFQGRNDFNDRTYRNNRDY